MPETNSAGITRSATTRLFWGTIITAAVLRLLPRVCSAVAEYTGSDGLAWVGERLMVYVFSVPGPNTPTFNALFVGSLLPALVVRCPLWMRAGIPGALLVLSLAAAALSAAFTPSHRDGALLLNELHARDIVSGASLPDTTVEGVIANLVPSEALWAVLPCGTPGAQRVVDFDPGYAGPRQTGLLQTKVQYDFPIDRLSVSLEVAPPQQDPEGLFPDASTYVVWLEIFDHGTISVRRQFGYVTGHVRTATLGLDIVCLDPRTAASVDVRAFTAFLRTVAARVQK
jgi:hypothetical protein